MWLLPLILLPFAIASLGDQDEDYQECVQKCQATPCHLSWNLRLLQWDCRDECRYQCMQQIVANYRRLGLAPWQYHGKWPFTRLWGIQEPASVLFSAGNAAAHWLGWKRYAVKARLPWMRRLVGGMLLTAVGAWAASVVFHTRDTVRTEKADYFGAAGHLLYALYVTICRMADVQSGISQILLIIPFVLFWLRHVRQLSAHFDYGWNMKVMVVVGMSFNLLWLAWALPRWKSLRHARWMGTWTLLGTSAGLLELFDFAPLWGFLDAHALWHLLTIPLNYWLYVIWAEDAAYLADEHMLLKTNRSRV